MHRSGFVMPGPGLVMPGPGLVMPSPGLVMPSLTRHLIFDQQLRNMIPIFDRGHIFSFCKEPDEVGLIVESAVIADLRGAKSGVREQVTGLCNPKIVDVGDKGYARLFFEEMAEC